MASHASRLSGRTAGLENHAGHRDCDRRSRQTISIDRGDTMDKRHMLSIVAALGLAGAACAQAQSAQEQQTPPPSSSSSSGSSDPSSASSPHQQEATGTGTNPSAPQPTTTEQSTDPSAASSPHQQETMRTAEAAGM